MKDGIAQPDRLFLDFPNIPIYKEKMKKKRKKDLCDEKEKQDMKEFLKAATTVDDYVPPSVVYLGSLGSLTHMTVPTTP